MPHWEQSDFVSRPLATARIGGWKVCRWSSLQQLWPFCFETCYIGVSIAVQPSVDSYDFVCIFALIGKYSQFLLPGWFTRWTRTATCWTSRFHTYQSLAALVKGFAYRCYCWFAEFAGSFPAYINSGKEVSAQVQSWEIVFCPSYFHVWQRYSHHCCCNLSISPYGHIWPYSSWPPAFSASIYMWFDDICIFLNLQGFFWMQQSSTKQQWFLFSISPRMEKANLSVLSPGRRVATCRNYDVNIGNACDCRHPPQNDLQLDE